MQLGSANNEEVESSSYRLDGAVAKESWVEYNIEFPREQLLSVRSDVNKYRQRLPLYTERFTADVTDWFTDFLYSLSREVRKLVKKQWEDVDNNVKTDFEAVYVFLQGIASKLSPAGPSS